MRDADRVSLSLRSSSLMAGTGFRGLITGSIHIHETLGSQGKVPNGKVQALIVRDRFAEGRRDQLLTRS